MLEGAAKLFRKMIDAKVGVKKVYTKRFYILDVEYLHKIAKETGTDVNKVMDLAFHRLIEEYKAEKAKEGKNV